MKWLFVSLAVLLLGTNIAATAVVLQSVVPTRLQRALQLALVWFVPLIGAAVCLIFAATDREARVRAASGPTKGWNTGCFDATSPPIGRCCRSTCSS